MMKKMKIDKLVMATNNKNKLREVREILSPLGIEVLSQREAGADRQSGLLCHLNLANLVLVCMCGADIGKIALGCLNIFMVHLHPCCFQSGKGLSAQ